LTPTNRLIVFTRYPQPGKAKTRLIPALGAEGAAALQRQMTEHTLDQVNKLVTTYSVGVEICFAGGGAASNLSDRQLMQNWLGSNWNYQPQGNGDLGARIIAAFQAAFEVGVQRAITIGTDCPGLDAARMVQAFQMLLEHDLVLGPALDGGYYLIGLRRLIPELFTEINWGTAEVLRQTKERAEQLGLAVAYLEPLADIDRPEDLPVWEGVLKASISQTSAAPKISVIIPVLNEAATIQAVLHSLQQTETEHAVEVVVVDGGSQDETVTLVKELGVKVLSSLPGRARQMNVGAEAATGEILLFLHADTRLPSRFITLVQQALASPNAIAGAFELQIEAEIPGIRWVERGVKWRSRQLQMPYGDQAIFLKAEVFRQLGGFAELPIMEDFDFVRRLQTQGRVAIAPAAVITSGRRWQKLGIVKTTLINQIAITAYLLGMPPEQIARWYWRR
jgi:rSAM/selenodomain-associated transferase 2/rSAM/selenodomain-associated transferase 1